MTTTILRTRVGITNVYILRERGTVVVDPGGPSAGPLGALSVRRILAALGEPPRADLIVVTHAHLDHVGASLACAR